LYGLREALEALRAENQYWSDQYSGGGDPLRSYGFASRATGIDLALRAIDAAIIRHEMTEGRTLTLEEVRAMGTALLEGGRP
jgi:hypothetical protein